MGHVARQQSKNIPAPVVIAGMDFSLEGGSSSTLPYFQQLSSKEKEIIKRADRLSCSISIIEQAWLVREDSGSKVLYWIFLPLMYLLSAFSFIQLVVKFLIFNVILRKRVRPSVWNFWWDGVSHICKDIKKHVTTHIALDYVYHARKYGAQMKGIQKFFTEFWLEKCMINPRGVRQRLHVTEIEIYKKLMELVRNGREEISIASFACGSSIAVLKAVKKVIERNNNVVIKTTLLDISDDALDMSRNFAGKLGLNFDNTNFVKGKIKDVEQLFQKEQFDVIEMVGYLDYKRDKECIPVLEKVKKLVKSEGYLVVATILNNPEKPFMDYVVQWHSMKYKSPERFATILKKSNLNYKIIVEPFRVHAIAVCTKE